VEVLDQVRYGVALALVGVGPAVLLLWVIVHPLARVWRRVGYWWGYVAGAALSVAAVACSVRFHRHIAATDLGASAMTLLLGLLFLGAAVVMRHQWRQQLTVGARLGLPELSPARYPGRLLTEGIYARVRHPRYLQIVVAVAGWALLANHLAGYLVILVVVAELAIVIPLEERELAHRFGAEYEAYRRRVPALWPRLRP
jgi:protein-S-isoprenylcysteine O-methyltransferase Ste14